MACSFRYLGTNLPKNVRFFSVTSSKRDAWLSKIFVRKIEPTKTPHSSMLSDKEVVYSLQTHNYRPDNRQEYLKNVANILELTKSEQQLSQAVELVGSWTVHVGDQDQAIHLWSFRGGFEKIDVANKVLTNNENYVKLWNEQAKLVRSRHLQYLLAFSYWPQIQLRKPTDKSSNIYEMRSYSLQPGTMIEWGNNWARAINYRQNNNEAFAGFFSQIGRLYNVHHIWCYKDLTARKETRESAWRSPGWDECVAYTVPLIREMHCRILQPTAFSPTQ